MCREFPGDKLEVKNKQLFINDVAQPHYKNMQFEYMVKTNGTHFTAEVFKKLGINWYNDFPEVMLYCAKRCTADGLFR